MAIKPKKDSSGMDIPDYVFESLARCLLPKMQQYYESEEGKQALAEWKEKHKRDAPEEK
ncbi:hypothetical protein LJC27_08295 [Christensenellaceae bacterium OttesenSCG-928-M15]|nr:hypothetical protein [Christensenellaceae bacterium OttesenSCG-928-M15]